MAETTETTKTCGEKRTYMYTVSACSCPDRPTPCRQGSKKYNVFGRTEEKSGKARRTLSGPESSGGQTEVGRPGTPVAVHDCTQGTLSEGSETHQ